MFDLPDPTSSGPRDAGPGPRFLPQYDNLPAGPRRPLPRARRARARASRSRAGRWIGTLLADGFYRANWSLAETGDCATLTVDRFVARRGDPPGARAANESEAHGVLALVAPDAAHRVAFA